MVNNNNNEDVTTGEIFDEELLEDEYEDKRRPGCLIKVMAVLLLVVFTAFSMPRLSYLFTDKLNFLDQNKVLQQDQIVQKCKPAVVSIEALTTDAPLNEVVHSGTGFNITPTGTIVTNLHVVANARTITITFGDGTKYYVNQYETIPGIDIAIIKIKGKDLPAIALDMQNQVKSGDIVTIIGNPLGFEKIAQRGEVGGFIKIAESQSQVFDIKLQVNPGSSGSPVINDQAQVVGIVFASTTENANGQAEPRCLAIPVQALPIQ